MSNDVFANGREISCKKADGKTICCFPDVCMTPPVCPATPGGVPIPYPNTGMAKDTAKGSRSVKITGKEIIKKNKSYFKTSYGDEPGCATPAKKGIVTGKIKGKVYFNAWSMDVKIEGKNAVRHLDITTHNHASFPGNSPTWPYLDETAIADSGHACAKDVKRERTACKDVENKVKTKGLPKNKINKAMREALCKDKKCREARKCMLQPETPALRDGQSGCCKTPAPKMTPHHVIPAHCFMPPGVRKSGSGSRYSGCEGYNSKKAPCICVTGKDKSTGDHKKIHDRFDPIENSHIVITSEGKKLAGTWEYQEAAHEGCIATARVTKCDPSCLRAQVDAYHKQEEGGPKLTPQTGLRAESSGNKYRNPSTYKPAIPEVILL